MDRGVEALVDTLLFEHVSLMTMDPRTTTALEEAREADWRIGIVTNGATAQQTLKIEHLGIEPYVDCVVISEAVGVKKPDAEIFRLAAQELGGVLTDGWMVGDHPIADVSGGRAAGLKTAWVSRGQDWPNDVPLPTLTRHSAAEVIDALIQLDARHDLIV
ncbi:FMN phosphatase YigB (HAD superfamily) [Arthrobacter sp. 2762]